jgi:hypothetical protein
MIARGLVVEVRDDREVPFSIVVPPNGPHVVPRDKDRERRVIEALRTAIQFLKS